MTRPGCWSPGRWTADLRWHHIGQRYPNSAGTNPRPAFSLADAGLERRLGETFVIRADVHDLTDRRAEFLAGYPTPGRSLLAHPHRGGSMIRTRRFVSALVVGAALGCSDTNAPLPEPQEVLLVVNSTANTLSIVPVDAPNSSVQVPLGGTTPTPVGVSAREGFALVPLGLDNAVAVVDLRAGTVLRTIPLPDNSGATGSAIVDDSIGYVGNPNLNTVSRVNYLTGATSEVPVGIFPQACLSLAARCS